MKAPIPPPLHQTEVAWVTYLKAFATTFPALVLWRFSDLFLLPKLEQLWIDTQLTASKAHWILNASHFFAQSTEYICAAAILLLIVLELWVRSWPRYRRAVIAVVAVAFQTSVLIGLAAISTAALLAAPVLLRHK